MSALLQVEELRVRLPTPRGAVTIVDGVDYLVDEGRVLGVAGESGSGKTISVLALMQLLPPGAEIGGRALYRGDDLFALRGGALRKLRGNDLAMVFQDPMTSLHPMLSIGKQLTEHVRRHERVSRGGAERRALELLDEVRIPDPEKALHSFPHQFSGGMRQRIAIAIALACRPTLLIADEPTTALDVTVQAGILRLLDRLRKDTGLGVILITHDLGVMSSIADDLSVFYAGRIVESGPTQAVIGSPRHPYTRALLEALPRGAGANETPLVPIEGTPPTPNVRPAGCAFHPRCSFATPECAVAVPALASVEERRLLACPVDPFRSAP